MSSPTKVAYDPIRLLAFGGIGVNYAPVGGPFDHPVRIIKISNNTDGDILISYDGITNHDFLRAATSQQYNYSSNNELPAGALSQPAQTSIYIKQGGAAPGAGIVFVTVIYAN